MDLAFIKAAYAPIDFNSLNVDGVPDAYTGRTMVIQACFVGTITIAANTGATYIVPPVPGVAYAFVATTTIVGSTAFRSVNYADYGTLFPTQTDMSSVVTGFRIIGTMLEVRPQSAVTTNAGLIVVAKVPMILSIDEILSVPSGFAATSNGSVNYNIDLTGANQAALTSGSCYTGHPNDGAYTIGLNSGNWNFQPIWNDTGAVPATGVPAYATSGSSIGTVSSQTVTPLTGQLLGVSGLNIPGYAPHETIVLSITNAASSALSFTIQVRQTIEYQVNPNSLLYQTAKPSPPPNPLALQVYAEVATAVPVAVEYSRNFGFWGIVVEVAAYLFGWIFGKMTASYAPKEPTQARKPFQPA
jgi:hypothetical protein